jgi:hypothetical protein
LGFIVGFAAEARLLLRHHPSAVGFVEIAGADPALVDSA